MKSFFVKKMIDTMTTFFIRMNLSLSVIEATWNLANICVSLDLLVVTQKQVPVLKAVQPRIYQDFTCQHVSDKYCI